MRASDELFAYQHVTGFSTTLQELETRYRGTHMPMLSSAEVARAIGKTTRTVRNWAKAGRLSGIKVGKLWRFRLLEIVAYVASRVRSDKALRSVLTDALKPERGSRAKKAVPSLGRRHVG